MRLYSTMDDVNQETDGGYPWHPDTKVWPEEWSAYISELTAAGDISRPMYSEQGIILFCRIADMGENGAIPLSDDDHTAILNILRTQAYTAAIEELVTEWSGDYDIYTDTSSLSILILQQ